jgi:hypothetical protein
MLITRDQAVALLQEPLLQDLDKALASSVALPLLRELSEPTIHGTMNDLYFSPYVPDQILRACVADRDLLIAFYRAVHDTPDGLPDSGEFPPGEELEEGPIEPSVILGIGAGIGVQMAVTMLLLRDRSHADLIAFLKGRRYPFASKYATFLKGVFKAVQESR